MDPGASFDIPGTPRGLVNSGENRVLRFFFDFFACQPKHRNCPKKLLIIPLDQELLVQQVFGIVELRQFFTVFFLVFEVGKLCRVNLESLDSTYRVSHIEVCKVNQL